MNHNPLSFPCFILLHTARLGAVRRPIHAKHLGERSLRDIVRWQTGAAHVRVRHYPLEWIGDCFALVSPSLTLCSTTRDACTYTLGILDAQQSQTPHDGPRRRATLGSGTGSGCLAPTCCSHWMFLQELFL
ncbi:hypothetical protein EJ05DRAFT_475293, partial [Pseudovirgaria hyperparasitica]